MIVSPWLFMENAQAPMRIPLLVPDLPTADELLPWLQQIDKNRWYTNFGPVVHEFEHALSNYLASRSCGPPQNEIRLTTVSSGTAAIELAVLAMAFPERSRVLLPAFTFPATCTAVQRAGLSPVFSDVDEKSWMLTPAIARAVLRHSRYDLVLPVATFGCPQPANEWDEFSRETGIPVLIDAAAGFGNQEIGGRALVAFSFHATKAFGIGEGGLVTARIPELIEKVRRLSNFGIGADGIISRSGGNAKMSEYHAAVGLAQLTRWSALREQNKLIWQAYQRGLKPLGGQIDFQQGPEARAHSQLPVLVPSGRVSHLTTWLTEQGIETRRWYCPPLPKHPAFSDIPCVGPDGKQDLPVTARLADGLLGLPFHTSLKETQIEFICEKMKEGLQ
jgi:dTDP-4-amino-4,6-dideoxygalactose transaminase